MLRNAVDLQVAGSYVVFGNKRLLKVDDLVEANVRMEAGLNFGECHDGAVSAANIPAEDKDSGSMSLAGNPQI